MEQTGGHLPEEILRYGQDCIQDELDGLNRLKSSLDSGFTEVVQLILKSNGRVIITGIGKSAIIAQKIVATMNSTGTPAIFMHAADAIHGDLGIIQKDDIVIAISKSGNTPEIKALCPLLQKFGNPLIGMVGNKDSFLAKSSDHILDTTIDKEACPHNLAPTTSTTSQLMMGDALAVALLKCKNFSSDDFSKYHPGGALGKRLYLTVLDISKHQAKPKVNPDSRIQDVIVEISKNRLGATAVVQDNKIVGIVTDGDIRRMIENTEQLTGINASDIMGKNPRTIEGATLAAEAAQLFNEFKVNQLIVTENGQYMGMIHIHDLYKEGIL